MSFCNLFYIRNRSLSNRTWQTTMDSLVTRKTQIAIILEDTIISLIIFRTTYCDLWPGLLIYQILTFVKKLSSCYTQHELLEYLYLYRPLFFSLTINSSKTEFSSSLIINIVAAIGIQKDLSKADTLSYWIININSRFSPTKTFDRSSNRKFSRLSAVWPFRNWNWNLQP